MSAMTKIIDNKDNNQQQGSEASAEAEQKVDIPDNAEEVKELLMTTIGDIWTSFVQHIPLLVVGLLIIIATAVVVSLADRVMQRFLKGRHMRTSLKKLIRKLVMVVLWVVGLLISAMVVFPGLTPTKALGGLGLLSLALGFAFKDIFENFFAGILLLWRFPFEPGDYIECEGVEGQVEDVTIRMTLIRETSGELIIVPNSFLFKNPVEVLTSQDSRRETIMTGVSYDADLGESVKIIEKAVKGCKSVKTKKPIQIFPQGFGDSSMDIEVTWWTDPKPVDIRSSRGEVVLAIKKALDDAGVEIPFPQRDLHVRDGLGKLTSAVKTKKPAAGSSKAKKKGK